MLMVLLFLKRMKAFSEGPTMLLCPAHKDDKNRDGVDDPVC